MVSRTVRFREDQEEDLKALEILKKAPNGNRYIIQAIIAYEFAHCSQSTDAILEEIKEIKEMLKNGDFRGNKDVLPNQQVEPETKEKAIEDLSIAMDFINTL